MNLRLTSYAGFTDDLLANGAEWAVSRAEQLGFESIELIDVIPYEETRCLPEKLNVQELLRALSSRGMSVGCYSLAVTLPGHDGEWLLGEIGRQIELAAALGSPFFHHTIILDLVYNPDAPSYEETLEQILPLTKRIWQMCRDSGISLVYEPQGMYFNGVEGLGRFLDRMRESCPGIGVVADIGNPLFVDADPYEVVCAFGDAVKHVHVKDYIVSDEPIEGKSGYVSRGGKHLYDCPPGEGGVGVGECIRYLIDKGYTGRVSVETEDCSDEGISVWVRYLRSL